MTEPVANRQVIEHSTHVHAPAADVERCFTQLDLIQRWLNPLLRCEPIGPWSTDVGGQSRFFIRLPLWQPTLLSTVVERESGLLVWAFEGFFKGLDRWECHPTSSGTQLTNRFEFEIPNPVVNIGYTHIAARWTQKDMAAQLERLKHLAETCGSRQIPS